MDNVNQLGKTLRNNANETKHNTRRSAENPALVHRSVDKVSPAQSYKHTFGLTNDNHRVSLSVNVKEADIPCITAPTDLYAASDTYCPSYATDPGNGSGIEYVGHEGAFASNIGGFTINPTGGVTVPLNGIYEIHWFNSYGGVSVGPGYLTYSLRNNGAIIATGSRLSSCGLCAFFGSAELWATVQLVAGDTISSWMGVINVAIWTPSDLCGIFSSGSRMLITLVGQG